MKFLVVGYALLEKWSSKFEVDQWGDSKGTGYKHKQFMWQMCFVGMLFSTKMMENETLGRDYWW